MFMFKNILKISILLVLFFAGAGNYVYAAASTPEIKKVYVFLARFQDSQNFTPPFTPDQLKSRLSPYNSILRRYYRENSYGKLDFEFDVSPWHRLPFKTAMDESNKSFNRETCASVVSNDVRNSIESDPISLSNYDIVAILSNRTCGVGGLAFGPREVLFKANDLLPDDKSKLDDFNFNWPAKPENDSVRILAHELGHAVGGGHAGTIRCQGQNGQIYPPCTSFLDVSNGFDASSLFDLLGQGGGKPGIPTPSHFNGFFKDLAGWLDDDAVVDIRQSGTYTLNPLELNSGKRVARVWYPQNDFPIYYLEFRRPIGFDSPLDFFKSFYPPGAIFPEGDGPLDGLMINYIYQLDLVDRGHFTKLINADFYSKDSLGLFRVGGPDFKDVPRGINISVKSISDSGITFKVDMDKKGCVRGVPLVRGLPDFPEVTNVEPGQSFPITIISRDGEVCSKAKIKIKEDSRSKIGDSKDFDFLNFDKQEFELGPLEEKIVQVSVKKLFNTSALSDILVTGASYPDRAISKRLLLKRVSPPLEINIFNNNGEVPFNVSFSINIEGIECDSTLNLDFGDGTKDQKKIKCPNSKKSVDMSHTYMKSGVFQITANAGAEKVSPGAIVMVRPKAPSGIRVVRTEQEILLNWRIYSDDPNISTQIISGDSSLSENGQLDQIAEGILTNGGKFDLPSTFVFTCQLNGNVVEKDVSGCINQIVGSQLVYKLDRK